MLRRPSPTASLWTARFFMVFGIILAVVGAAWAVKTWTFTHNTRATIGKFEGYETRRTTSRSHGRPRSRTSHYPKFSFQDDQGHSHNVTSSTGASADTFTEGQDIAVLYDPRNPEDARINTFTQLWLGPVAVSGLGLLFFGIGIFTQRWRR